MKSNASLDREIALVARYINEEKNPLIGIGPRGSTKYEVAFAILKTLRWARGRREEYPGIALAAMRPDGAAKERG